MPEKSSNGIPIPMDKKTVAFFDEGSFAYYECKENRDYFLDKQPQSVFKYISDEIHERSVQIHKQKYRKAVIERTIQIQQQKQAKLALQKRQKQQQLQQRNYMAPLPLINSGNGSVNG